MTGIRSDGGGPFPTSTPTPPPPNPTPSSTPPPSSTGGQTVGRRTADGRKVFLRFRTAQKIKLDYKNLYSLWFWSDLDEKHIFFLTFLNLELSLVPENLSESRISKKKSRTPSKNVTTLLNLSTTTNNIVDMYVRGA